MDRNLLEETDIKHAVQDNDHLITLPNPDAHALSIRATALVFSDPRSARLLNYIERIAYSDASVLIIGETGTGKELVAREIHKLSERHSGPFIAVNCGAFAETLIESELFGHERGAFTGAATSRSGWFEAASGGTLFLDEIGDLPFSAQVKILRVLQEREVVRLGSRTPIPIDVRLVAATNVNLEDAVKAGKFREDLYYRIKVASLDLLPLRERPGDILPLALHFLERYGKRLKLNQAVLTPDAEQALLSYSWPGNIRELENIIHHAILICKDSKVSAPDLHLNPNFTRPSTGAQTLTSMPLALLENSLNALYESAGENLFDAIDEAVFRSAYLFCEKNQVQTSKLLGISRNILRHRLKLHGILN